LADQDQQQNTSKPAKPNKPNESPSGDIRKKGDGYRRTYNKRRRYYSKQTPRKFSNKIKTSFKKLSIIVPLYNEEESIKPLVNEIKEIARTDKRFRFISFRKNYGKSAALHIGFKNAKGNAVVTIDADLQDDPQEILNLLKKLDEGYDLCSGWKKKRRDPFIKKYSSKFFNFVTRLISGIKIHDFNCGLKAYRKEVVENIKVYGEMHRYIPVLAKWQGFKITEIPVQHHPRRYGKSKYGISRFFKGFVDLITVTFATRYIKRPMHFFGFFGALAFIIGVAVLGYLTVLWIQGQPLSNRPMIFLGMLLIIVGVQMFSVGLLGEMLVHNSMDEKEYVIKEKS